MVNTQHVAAQLGSNEAATIAANRRSASAEGQSLAPRAERVLTAAVFFGPRFCDSAWRAPATYCFRHVAHCDEYRPSRRKNAPTSPLPRRRSASWTTHVLYSTVNRRRPDRAVTPVSTTGLLDELDISATSCAPQICALIRRWKSSHRILAEGGINCCRTVRSGRRGRGRSCGRWCRTSYLRCYHAVQRRSRCVGA